MRKTQPILDAGHLYLRPFSIDDAALVTQYCSHKDFSRNTINIPPNYTIDKAVQWLSALPKDFILGKSAVFAIVERAGDLLVGAIGLHFHTEHNRAEMGYWVGNPFWGKGYCTGAANAIIRYGFDQLKLNRIYATHMTHNPGSGKVMQKVGMAYEGCMKEHLFKDDFYVDIACYGITRKQWEAQQKLLDSVDDLIANLG